MKEKEKRWRSYLTIEFPDSFTEEHIEKLKVSLQEILSINNRGAIVKKVDLISNTN
jgi:hypothetical protein